MTMLITFAPPARQAVIRAGLLASEGGATRLGDGYLLLALAESQPLTSPVDLGVTATMVRAELGALTPRRHDGDLLATLGIDLDQIRRHVEAQFGPNAIANLYASPVGWNLRPRGPLCDLGLSPQLKRTVDNALGRCWDTAPPQIHERLLLHTLDSDSDTLTAVLSELNTSVRQLRAAVTARLRIAS